MSSSSGQAGGPCHPDSFVLQDSALVRLFRGCLGAEWWVGLSAGRVNRWNAAGLGRVNYNGQL